MVLRAAAVAGPRIGPCYPWPHARSEKSAAFGDDDDEQTEASRPGDLTHGFGDDDDKTESSNPKKDLPFTPAGLDDEDEEATVLKPPPPKKP